MKVNPYEKIVNSKGETVYKTQPPCSHCTIRISLIGACYTRCLVVNGAKWAKDIDRFNKLINLVKEEVCE